MDIFDGIDKVTMEVRRTETGVVHADFAIVPAGGQPIYDRLKDVHEMGVQALDRLRAAVIETLQQRALDKELR